MDTESQARTVPGVTVTELRSSNVDQTFEVSVALPRAPTPDRSYPVLYFTDANVYLPMLNDIVSLMQLAEELPEMIIVGIGYPIGDFFTDDRARDLFQELRRRDLLPEEGAAAFLSFLRDELMPFVDERYATDPADRTYFGYSAGGQFGLHTLFHQPETFTRYVIGSPGVRRNRDAWLRLESEYAHGHSARKARVFLSIGALEPGVEDVTALGAALAGRGHQGLELSTVVIEQETHYSGSSVAMNRGLRAVFAGV